MTAADPHHTSWRFLIALGLIALLLAGPAGSPRAAEAPAATSSASTEIQGKTNLPFAGGSSMETRLGKAGDRMASGLKRLIDNKVAEQAKTGRLPLAAVKDRIRVMLQLADGASFDPNGIISRGGRVLHHRPNLIAAELPPDQVETLLNANPGIRFARLPHQFHPLSVTSEGVSLTGASNFHSSGYRGAGVKVAVIDIGFKGLTAAQAAGDLPTNVVTHDFTGLGLETRYKHGTGCAEIVHDMAPDAELHLLKIADEPDIYAAFAYCLEQGIHIVSLSIGTFGSGPGNGTGPIDEACDAARANGILVVAAAGNSGNTVSGSTPIGPHWEGVFTDVNNDNIHEFAPGVQGNILVGVGTRDDDNNPEHNEVTIVMRWNDWPGATTDYDMYLYNYDYPTRTRGSLVASSADVQNGSQPPVEGIVVDVPDNQQLFFELVVQRKPGPTAGKELEIQLLHASAFVPVPFCGLLATSNSSIMEPADAASVLAVGAISQWNWYFGPQEDYSSQGPTNAWAGSPARIKPDICGPDGVSTNTYGASFQGTSAAAPHVAGAAALVKSLHKNILPGHVQSHLESWAQDMGTPGKDNLYGAGKLQIWMGNSPPVLDPIGDKAVSEGRLLRFSISASDPDGDTLTYEAFGLPAGATFNPTSRTFFWRPSYRQGGWYPVTFRVWDGMEVDCYYYRSINVTVLDAPPLGDLDDSGTVDLRDAVLAQQVLAGLDVSGSLRPDYAASGADVNGNGIVENQELIFILQVLADLR